MIPRAARLKRNRDFRAVYARRRSYSGEHLVLYIRPWSREERRISLDMVKNPGNEDRYDTHSNALAARGENLISEVLTDNSNCERGMAQSSYKSLQTNAVGTLPVKSGVARVGYVISKKVAKKAHDRNLLKRRLREISRIMLLPHLKSGVAVDMLYSARASAVRLSFSQLMAEMEALSRQAGLL